MKAKPKSYKVAENDNFADSALSYDVSTTQFANYKALGLLADANQIGATKGRVTGFKPRVKGPSAAVVDEEYTHPLELEVPEGELTVKQVPDGERKVLLALMLRHGEDFSAMARDMRLNTHQHTGAHLRRRISKLKLDDVRDAAVAAARVTEGKKPKLKKKITKNPNRAFKRNSMNFN